jgi:hypothetical protein
MGLTRKKSFQINGLDGFSRSPSQENQRFGSADGRSI